MQETYSQSSAFDQEVHDHGEGRMTRNVDTTWLSFRRMCGWVLHWVR